MNTIIPSSSASSNRKDKIGMTKLVPAHNTPYCDAQQIILPSSSPKVLSSLTMDLSRSLSLSPPSTTGPTLIPSNDTTAICFQDNLTMRSKDASPRRLSLIGQEDGLPTPTPRVSIDDLPPEILGTILDHLLGHMASISSTHTFSTPQASKSVASVMRHPRRKALSDIALVSQAWRRPVQERIYRHIKVKGTRSGLAESADWFIKHNHLAQYVRHIEVWIPVWGDRTAVVSRPIEEEPVVPNMETARQFDGGMISPDVLAGTLAFKLATYNATLAEVFQHVGCFYPHAKIFTLEGGHCKKSRLIQAFPGDRQGVFESLPQIRTFVMKGTWNLMRDSSRWSLFEQALPNVQEWHCGYARPQFEAYATINDILATNTLSTIKHLNINLEGFYSKDPTLTSSHPASRASFHLCHQLGKIAHRLESIVFGGKICSAFFLSAWKVASRTGTISNLRSIDVGVKNCCRPRTSPEDETGDTVVGDSASITSMSFIQAFDNMVTAAVFSLSAYPLLRYLRIRFIDLDSACPLLNPYFQLSGGNCTGLWNEEILEMLSQFRPGVYFEELNDGIYGQARKEGDVITAIYPRSRPRSIKSSSYRLLTESRL